MISSGFSMLHPVLNVFLYRYQMLKFLASSPEFVGEIRFREFAKLVI